MGAAAAPTPARPPASRRLGPPSAPHPRPRLTPAPDPTHPGAESWALSPPPPPRPPSRDQPRPRRTTFPSARVPVPRALADGGGGLGAVSPPSPHTVASPLGAEAAAFRSFGPERTPPSSVTSLR